MMNRIPNPAVLRALPNPLADGNRLDWLAEGLIKTIEIRDTTDGLLFEIAGDVPGPVWEGKTLREAIDKAMEDSP